MDGAPHNSSTSAPPLQLDALAVRQTAARDELIELTRVERFVEGESHDGLALGRVQHHVNPPPLESEALDAVVAPSTTIPM